jgi:hypothetical protein
MEFELINKRTNEIIDTKSLADVLLSEAKTYFVRMKDMKEKEFDKLFEVKVKKKKKKQLLPYRWWIEEKAITDELLKDL